MIGTSTTMTNLAYKLSVQLDRPVTDRPDSWEIQFSTFMVARGRSLLHADTH